MSLGSILVRLTMNTADFDTDSKRAAKIAEKRAKEIDDSFRKAGKAIGTALGAGLLAVGAGMGAYLRNTIEAEKVQAQLASRIEDTGGIAGRTLEQLNAQAEALAGMTIFDDEAIGGVQAMLLTFKEIRGVNFDDAVATVLDLSTAMGVSLDSAAKQLGKALNDPIRGVAALAEAGVTFTTAQRDMIREMVEAGDMVGAQQLILAEFEGQMGSAAEAARDTLGGALQGLRNDFDNLLEGDTSEGGLKGTVTAVNELSTLLRDPELKGGVDELASGLLGLATGAVKAAAGFGELIGKYRDWLEDQGFSPDLGEQSMDQLEARRARIQQTLKRFDPLGIGDAVAGDTLRQELAAVDRMIREFSVPIITGKADFSGVTGGAVGGWEPRRGGGSDGKTKTGKSDAEKAAESLDRAYESMNDRLREQAALFGDTSEAAKVRYEIESGALQELDPARQAELIRSAELVDLKKAEQKAYEESIELAKEEARARAEQAEAVDRLLGDMRFEIQVMGMSNVEREKAIALRYANVDAMTEEGRAQAEAIGRMVEELEQARESQMMIDDLKGVVTDFAADAASGFGSVGDAFEDMADRIKRIAIQMLAEKAVEWLFGAMFGGGGSNLPGQDQASGGGFWSSMFGGARASGGPVSGGTAYLVGEKGPELFVPGASGQVVPNGALGGGVQVILNLTNKGQPVEARQTGQRQDGNRVIVDMVLDAVADDMSRGGRTARAGEQRYGWSRRGVPVGS